MARLAERTVLFADLRGSTTLFATRGNAAATAVVTQTVRRLAPCVGSSGGLVIKTLGDGLMAIFAVAEDAVEAASRMHDVLSQLIDADARTTPPVGLRSIKLQVGLAHGEVVELADDCFGDAVNVAARLLEHAGDNETVATEEVVVRLPQMTQALFRRLDRIVLRGRQQPVSVFTLAGRAHADTTAATQFGEVDDGAAEPDTIVLRIPGAEHRLHHSQLPLVLGRSPKAQLQLDDSRVSRVHARIDWHGGAFQITDLSFNGTCVRFGDGELLNLRRGACTLHGQGAIGLGGTPDAANAVTVLFDIQRSSAAAA